MMSPAQIEAYNSNIKEQEKEAYDALSKMPQHTKETAQRRAGLMTIQTDMNVLEAATKKWNLNIDDVLSSKTRAVFGGSAWSSMMDKYNALIKTDREHADKWENERNKISEAGQRIMQLLAGEINSYYKDTSGAAVVPLEEQRLQMLVHSGANYSKIATFVRSESEKSHRQVSEILASLPPAAQAKWLNQTGSGRSRLGSQSISPGAPEPGKDREKTSRFVGPEKK
jgi:DNA repair ATPase RecN